MNTNSGYVYPNVPECLPPTGQIPEGYRLMVAGWSFPESRIGETVEIGGERIKKMLTLDVNIPEEGFAAKVNAFAPGSSEAKKVFAKNYPCPHACPGCFNNAALANPIMTLAEVMNVIDQAKELGLESIKFLGPGELLANKDLFPILDTLLAKNIIVCIFTKGAIMGNDMLAQRYHGMSSEEFTRKIAAYPNVTFLVSVTSFDPMLENRFVPQNLRYFRTKFDFHAARNLAIERLCKLGMNTDLMRQRLELVCAPVTENNVHEAFELYRWGEERNIPVVLPPTMVSGKGHSLVHSAAEDQFQKDYIQLAVEVNVWAIRRGVLTLEELQTHCATPYIGIAPCNQLTHGLYIHYDGQVWMCPGNDTPDFVVDPDIRKTPLVEIWKHSRNYSINLYNNGCVKYGISLPNDFSTEVLRRVAELLGEK